MNQFKIGDRVIIIGDRYHAHPSRMRGSTGTVTSVTRQVWVMLDNVPADQTSTWPFFPDELHMDFSFVSIKFYRVGETETHALSEALTEAYNMSKDMKHPVQVYRIGDNEVLATIIAE